MNAEQEPRGILHSKKKYQTKNLFILEYIQQLNEKNLRIDSYFVFCLFLYGPVMSLSPSNI